jgi:plastocyanin
MSYKMSRNAKTVVACVIVVAILIPIVLSVALADPCAMPYLKQEGITCPTSTTIVTSATSGSYTVTMPQGASNGLNFSPASLTVGSGSTITFMDQDSGAPHNVWFTSVPTGAANPNTVANQSSYYQLTNGQSTSYVLTTPGVYKYECQFHQGWMQGSITVVQSSSVTTTSTSSTSTTTTTTNSTTSTSSSSPTGAIDIIPQGASEGTNFSPAKFTVVIGVNNTITWEDQDSGAPHNVYFTSVPTGATNPNPANVPTLVKGSNYSVTLTVPGTYDFECQFHTAWMQGVITVVQG